MDEAAGNSAGGNTHGVNFFARLGQVRVGSQRGCTKQDHRYRQEIEFHHNRLPLVSAGALD
jgi:hypothetical protein